MYQNDPSTFRSYYSVISYVYDKTKNRELTGKFRTLTFMFDRFLLVLERFDVADFASSSGM